MTATTHHAIRGLTTRFVIGTLVLWVLLLMGIGITQTYRPTDLSVDSLP